MNKPETLELVWSAIIALASRHGAAPLNKHQDCWCCEIDERWFLACNGHREPRNYSRGGELRTADILLPGITVPPFCIMVEYNGFVAGLIDAHGASFAAGTCANLETFHEALQKHLEKAA